MPNSLDTPHEHALELAVTSGPVHYIKTGERLSFWLSPARHRRAALKRGAWTALAVTVVTSLVLAPDYLATYSGESALSQALFFASILAVSALLGFALALSKWATRERWHLDVARGELALERGLLLRAPREEVIDLAHVSALEFDGGGVLIATLEDGQTIKLIDAGSGQEDASFREDLLKFAQKVS